MLYGTDVIVLNGGAVTGSGSGSWIRVDDYLYKSIQFKVTGTVSAEIRVSNEPAQPLDSDDETLYSTAVSTNTVVDITPIIHWLKVKPVTITGGSLTANFIGLRHRVRFSG